jgi:alginate O-acetyltransferase complex protein AlgJ
MNPPTNNTSHRRSWFDWILISVFLFLLWLPTLDTFFDLDHARLPNENRLPAVFPEIHRARPDDLQKFLNGFDAYFNDNFGFRKQLIRWFQNWKIGLFHDRSVYKVISGQNHWLFTSDLQMVEHYLGMAKFTPQQLKLWQVLLEKRRDWLAQRGIKYLFVIPPDKQTIYPEELPAWLVNATPTNRMTKLDQFLKYMRENSTVEILDLRQPLMEAKNIRPTYLQNDTHWNLFGSFIACQEVIKTLSRQMSDLPTLDSRNFTWTNTPVTGGDLAAMIGSDALDKNHFQFAASLDLPPPNIFDATNIISVWDSHKKSIIIENSAPLRRTAVIFNDSFGGAWQQFLGYSFKKIIFMSENREFNPAVILANKPDIVISEMLERYFNTQSPEELMDKQPLP